MLESILAILGAIGGLAGFITFIKFWMTRKSYIKKTDAEVDSLSIQNMKEVLNVMKEKLSMQNEEISSLKKRINELESNSLKSSCDLKDCISKNFELEEKNNILKSIIHYYKMCKVLKEQTDCPILKKYNELIKNNE